LLPAATAFVVETLDRTMPQIWIGATLADRLQTTDLPLKVLFFTSCKAQVPIFQNSLQSQAEYILMSILSKKNEKCRLLGGKLWLAIVNTCPILTREQYLASAMDLEKYFRESCFSRVFLIDGQEAVELINLEGIVL
jgi:hypothetical protein